MYSSRCFACVCVCVFFVYSGGDRNSTSCNILFNMCVCVYWFDEHERFVCSIMCRFRRCFGQSSHGRVLLFCRFVWILYVLVLCVLSPLSSFWVVCPNRCRRQLADSIRSMLPVSCISLVVGLVVVVVCRRHRSFAVILSASAVSSLFSIFVVSF